MAEYVLGIDNGGTAQRVTDDPLDVKAALRVYERSNGVGQFEIARGVSFRFAMARSIKGDDRIARATQRLKVAVKLNSASIPPMHK